MSGIGESRDRETREKSDTLHSGGNGLFMNTHEAYQLLSSIRSGNADSIEPERLDYFKGKGLVISFGQGQYKELVGLWSQGSSLYMELHALAGTADELRHRISRGCACHYADSERAEEYERLSKRVGSRWHRAWTRRDQLKSEEARRSILAGELKSGQDQLKRASEKAGQELENVEIQLQAKYLQYTGLVRRTHDVVVSSQAYRLWELYHYPDPIVPPGGWQSAPGWISRAPDKFYRGSMSSVEGLWYYLDARKKAIEGCHQLTIGDYVATTENGTFVIEGIKSAKLQDETDVDFDIVLEFVEAVMRTRLPGRHENDINWDLIDVPAALLQIGQSRKRGEGFWIEFQCPHSSDDSYETSPFDERNWGNNPG